MIASFWKAQFMVINALYDRIFWKIYFMVINVIYLLQLSKENDYSLTVINAMWQRRSGKRRKKKEEKTKNRVKTERVKKKRKKDESSIVFLVDLRRCSWRSDQAWLSWRCSSIGVRRCPSFGWCWRSSGKKSCFFFNIPLKKSHLCLLWSVFFFL